MKRLSILGVDIGASNIRVHVIDGNDTFSKKHAANFSEPKTSIVEEVRLMIGSRRRFDAIGIAVAGFVSSTKGRILKMPNAGIENLDIADIFRDAFDCDKVKVMNDAVAAVYGEWVNGKERDADILYLTFSTGIGGAAILEGRPVAGREGNAHEVGHIVIDPEEKVVCGCGARGHWEAYCSGRGLVSFFRFFAKANNFKEKSLEEMTAEKIFRLSKEGDPLLINFLDSAVRLNSSGIASVVNVYSPEILVIGGSVALHNWENYILPSVNLAARKIVLSMPEIKRSALGDYASSYGSAMLAASYFD